MPMPCNYTKLIEYIAGGVPLSAIEECRDIIINNKIIYNAVKSRILYDIKNKLKQRKLREAYNITNEAEKILGKDKDIEKAKDIIAGLIDLSKINIKNLGEETRNYLVQNIDKTVNEILSGKITDKDKEILRLAGIDPVKLKDALVLMKTSIRKDAETLLKHYKALLKTKTYDQAKYYSIELAETIIRLYDKLRKAKLSSDTRSKYIYMLKQVIDATIDTVLPFLAVTNETQAYKLKNIARSLGVDTTRAENYATVIKAIQEARITIDDALALGLLLTHRETHPPTQIARYMYSIIQSLPEDMRNKAITSIFIYAVNKVILDKSIPPVQKAILIHKLITAYDGLIGDKYRKYAEK
jgi:hypothetical protein